MKKNRNLKPAANTSIESPHVDLDIGIESGARKRVIVQLNQELANAYVALVKTKKAHWDVVGPQFRSLHLMLDEQYVVLAGAVDEYAERVRMLGGYSIATMHEFVALSELTESSSLLANATEAVTTLVRDQETLSRSVRRSIAVCTDSGDVGTADLFTRILQQHEKMAWMLRSFLQGEAVQPTLLQPSQRVSTNGTRHDARN